MGINPADAAAHQAMAFDEREYLIIGGYEHMRQAPQKRQYFRTASQGTARQFADDEGVTLDFASVEQSAESRVAPPQMLYPDRSINQHGGEQREDGFAGAV
jgi:hypothetical protein